MAWNGCVSMQKEGRGHADALALLTHRHSLEPTPSENKPVCSSNLNHDIESRKSKPHAVNLPRASTPSGSPINPPEQMVLKKVNPLIAISLSLCDAVYDSRWPLLGVVMSFVLCDMCHMVHVSLVDPSFFKAIGLLLAVMLSLRAKNALSRRQAMMASLMQMMNSAWSIICVVDPEDCNPQRLVKYLAFCFQEVAIYIDDVSDWKDLQMHAMRIEELDEADRETAFIMCQKGYYHESPRPLLVRIRQVCDQMFEPDKHLRLSGGVEKVDKTRIIRRFHCNIDKELGAVLAKFDSLRLFKEPYLTIQYVSMVNMVMFIYMFLYPWLVSHESTLLLGVTCIGMGMVFYGLNHVTVGLESPMTQRGQGFNLVLTFHQMFGQLEYQAKVRERCKQVLEENKVEDRTFDEMHAEMKRYVATLHPHPHHSDSDTTNDSEF